MYQIVTMIHCRAKRCLVLNFTDLRPKLLSLDLETTHNGKIFAIGAVQGGRVFQRSGSFNQLSALNQLDQFAADADFILGHNLLRHDFPCLAAISPKLKLLQKPVVDTLLLSPLAFPENPYHRLVKDYKLVRESRNDPVADARLALFSREPGMLCSSIENYDT